MNIVRHKTRFPHGYETLGDVIESISFITLHLKETHGDVNRRPMKKVIVGILNKKVSHTPV